MAHRHCQMPDPESPAGRARQCPQRRCRGTAEGRQIPQKKIAGLPSRTASWKSPSTSPTSPTSSGSAGQLLPALSKARLNTSSPDWNATAAGPPRKESHWSVRRQPLLLITASLSRRPGRALCVQRANEKDLIERCNRITSLKIMAGRPSATIRAGAEGKSSARSAMTTIGLLQLLPWSSAPRA